MPPPRRTVRKARQLRRTMTLPEVKLWTYLRTRPEGLKFRHQHPNGPYVVDFYCASAKLAIEIDGIVHGMGDNPERDETRDAWLVEHGCRVLRIPAPVVLDEFEVAVRMILAEVAG